ncbi:hypothetical protein V6292_22845, partial [Serratia marcescens]
LLRGHNQYVGRSLKVNGSDYRDTYNITMECVGNKVHFYVSSENYPNNKFDNENAQDTELGFYIGSITV